MSNFVVLFYFPAGQPSILKIKCYHPGGHRRPPNRQSSFSDWVLQEGQNLRQNGHVYRVAESNRKAVRFSDKDKKEDLDLDEDPVLNKQVPSTITFQPPPHQHRGHRNFVATIPEEPESASETNSIHLPPSHGGEWDDGSLV